jgi:hypothetical protein
LASSTDTSWRSEEGTGRSDKAPILVQHAEQGASVSTGNILPRHGILAWNPLNIPLERYRVGEPSLSSEEECDTACKDLFFLTGQKVELVLLRSPIFPPRA